MKMVVLAELIWLYIFAISRIASNSVLVLLALYVKLDFMQTFIGTYKMKQLKSFLTMAFSDFGSFS